jgi:hypothetical protein
VRQEVEDRLRLLAAFLGDVLGRARARADSGRGWSALFDARGGGGGRSGGLPAAKRPRVEEAAKQELQRCVDPHSSVWHVFEICFICATIMCRVGSGHA